MNSFSDCLVLKITELVTPFAMIYIIYDKKNHKYLIRGRNVEPYSFECESENNLSDFIMYSVFPGKINEVLYNYNNLPSESNDITYNFLAENQSPDYEIVRYNCKHLKRKRLVNSLQILKYVSNDY